MKQTRGRINHTWLATGTAAAALLASGGYAVVLAGGDSAEQPAVQRATRRAPAGQPAPEAVAAARIAYRQASPARLARTLTRRLAGRTAGAYLASGKVVVPVTTAADARTVRRAGATPKMVARSGADLARTTAALRASAPTTGTGWAVDPARGQVVVWADPSVTGQRMTRLRRTLAAQGGAVRLERLPGRLTTRIGGGAAIFGQGVRCSLGFNARRGDALFFLTAGHCGNVVRTWFGDAAGNDELGVVQESSFPGDDFAVAQVTDPAAATGGVELGGGQVQEITGAADPVVGQRVRRSGSTTGVHDGQVIALNATVNYPEGAATGMIETTVCAEPGDSGGPLFSGGTALGLTSGGSGDCASGGITFFQPVTEPLEEFDLEVF